VRPEADPHYPRESRFVHGRVQSEELCPKCGHVARVSIYYAPDIGRNWLHCSNQDCCHQYLPGWRGMHAE
jgi:ssDNA-binding Zn-finger/Zn-ribbon topoisomerase 1